jgi:RecB family endonuclease NucS
MALYQIEKNSITKVVETTFEAEEVKERGDLQRLLRDNVEIIAPGTMVIAEEFGEWEDARRRIDLLAIDKSANLVVIELKRTEEVATWNSSLFVMPRWFQQ